MSDYNELRFATCNEDLRYNFRKGNYFGLYNALCNKDWSRLMSIANVDDACSYFYKEIYELLDAYIPKCPMRTSVHPVWFTPNIIEYIKRKRRLWKRYTKFKFQRDLNQVNALRKLIKREIKKAYANFVSAAEHDIKKNPNKLWSYINLKRNNTSIPGNMFFQNEELMNPQDIVNSFAKYFKSVFVSDTSDSPVCDTSCDASIFLHSSVISAEDIYGAAKKLKPNFTAGPDCVPSFFVKDCVSCLCDPLCYLYNLVIRDAYFPTNWKSAKVTPVFKGGNRHDIQNYRPIAVISNFAKLFESIVAKCLFSHVSGLINDSQHGFIQGRSTSTNLCEYVQFISNHLDSRKQVDVIYTDLSKAFDVVSHDILLTKLSKIGLCDKLVNLFKSLLSDRKQFVQYNGYRSFSYITSSGVTQGSNLGPILFVIFLNDALSQFECPVFAYADDVKIASCITTPEDCLRLQADLDNFTLWCTINKLKINVNKCKSITFSRLTTNICYDYTLNTSKIENVRQIKDLGVIIDRQLTFVPHIQYICDHATKMLGFIYRNTKNFTNTDSLCVLFYAFIRSKLEYCAIIWTPFYKAHINSLENIQKKFCKRLFYIKYGTYPVRSYPYDALLEEFNIRSLRARRMCAGMLFLYKLIHGSIVCTNILNDIHFLVPRLTCRHTKSFFISICRTNQHHHAPLNTMCRSYNSISSDVDIFFPNVKIFAASCMNAIRF